MIGRADERVVIERLLADARAGRSGALVLSGEPGVGKSVLLAHALERADGMRVMRAIGVETEIDLAFAGLDQLVRPVLSLAERLPARQADALLAALGRIDHVNQDRFLVATREGHWPGLPWRQVGGLAPDAAAELLRARAREVAPDVRDRLVEETGGNPLALVELVGALSEEQLTGLEPLPRPLPLGPRIQEAFLARVRMLPDATQTLLLVAAADDTADPAVVFRAAADLGVAADAMEAAEQAGLASVDGGRVAFRHPLVRASVYQGSTFAARLAAHKALAGALDGDEHAERRVWHLASTAIGPDQAIARELERSAERSRRRGGYAVAAAAFERAAELSTARADGASRLAAAARASFQAGQADRAAGLADRAERLVDDPVTADDVALLRGRIEFARGSAVAAHALLLRAARGMAGRDPRAAAVVLVEAARAAWNASDQARYTEATAMLAALELPGGDPLGPVVSTAIAIGGFLAGPPAAAVTRMRRGIDAWRPLVTARDTAGHDEEFVEASLALTGFTRVTGDDAAGLELGASPVAECRTHGLAAWLPWALANLSMTEAIAGRHSAATVSATEGLRLARDLGQPTAICSCEAILAWGAPSGARRTAATSSPPRRSGCRRRTSSPGSP